MAKRISVEIIIKGSELRAKPTGTSGDECLDVMRFLEYLPGLKKCDNVRTGDDGPESAQTSHETQVG